MTFRQLSVGDFFRFPQYDDPWRGAKEEGAVWRKVGHSFYANIKSLRKREGIDDPNRSVYKDDKVAAH